MRLLGAHALRVRPLAAAVAFATLSPACGELRSGTWRAEDGDGGHDGAGDAGIEVGDPGAGDLAADWCDGLSGDCEQLIDGGKGDPCMGDGMPLSDGGDSAIAGGDAASGDSASGGDEPVAGDSGPAVERRLHLQATPAGTPMLLEAATTACVDALSTLYLEGPASGPWRIDSADALGNVLPVLPASPPGELVPEYLGGGVYSDAGYATVAGSELPAAAATLTIEIDTEQWVISNTCAAALLRIWIYDTGLGGGATLLDSGAQACPEPAPWTVAIEAPIASRYEVLVFDFADSSVDQYDEVTLQQDGSGLVVMPPLPTDGRLELALLDSTGQEVESVAVTLSCQ
jgi:hypothetical protein